MTDLSFAGFDDSERLYPALTPESDISETSASSTGQRNIII